MNTDEARVCRAALDAIEVDLGRGAGWLDSIRAVENRLRGPHTRPAFDLLDSLADASVVDPHGMIRQARLDVSWAEAHAWPPPDAGAPPHRPGRSSTRTAAETGAYAAGWRWSPTLKAWCHPDRPGETHPQPPRQPQEAPRMITIRGSYQSADGRPATGSVAIQPLGDGWPNPLFWAPPAGGPAVTNAPVEARLDTGGRIEVALTWPSSSGIGRYRVTERLDGTPPRWWDTPLEDGADLALLRPR